MKNLLKKELLLTVHPTSWLFLVLSAMLLIPNYPYYVAFFYTSLGVFFTCLNGRENNDVFYTLTLPVAKKDAVSARYAVVVLLQVAQVILAAPFAALRQTFPMGGNQVGMDANIALFGSALVMLGLFNLVFFGVYYKNVQRVGAAFLWGSVAEFLYMAVAEVLVHVVPFVRDVLDTPDTVYVPQKLIVLAVGLVLYLLLTGASYRRSVAAFEKQDL